MGNKNKTNKSKRNKRSPLSLLFLLIGLLLMTYPFAAQGYKKIADSKIIQEFKDNKLKGSKLEDFKKDMDKYNKKVEDGAFNSDAGDIDFDADPDNVSDVNNSVIEEKSILNMDGDKRVLGTLIIPKIEEEMPVYYGSDAHTLQLGIGLLENTSYPGYKTGHSVLTGHRGTHNASLFKRLDEMTVDDAFYIELYDDILKYKVYDFVIVKPEQVQDLKIEEGRDLTTLITCHPFLINTERILVKGERAPMTPEDYALLGINQDDDKPSVKNEELTKAKLMFYGLILLDLLFLLFFLYVFFKTIKEKREDRRLSKMNYGGASDEEDD